MEKAPFSGYPQHSMADNISYSSTPIDKLVLIEDYAEKQLFHARARERYTRRFGIPAPFKQRHGKKWPDVTVIRINNVTLDDKPLKVVKDPVIPEYEEVMA